MEIIVLDKAFVYLGEVSFKKVDGIDFGYINNAKNIRRWGTEKGLGQLAIEGIQKDTVLDDCGDIKFPVTALIHIIKCKDNNSW